VEGNASNVFDRCVGFCRLASSGRVPWERLIRDQFSLVLSLYFDTFSMEAP
jgi:hypothetical protein